MTAAQQHAAMTDFLCGCQGRGATVVPGLDAAIAPAVGLLRAHGVETFESCQGGEGHAYPEPAVRFHGQRYEGFRALSVAILHEDATGLRVHELRRVWRVEDGEPTGPWWELAFRPRRAETP